MKTLMKTSLSLLSSAILLAGCGGSDTANGLVETDNIQTTPVSEVQPSVTPASVTPASSTSTSGTPAQTASNTTNSDSSVANTGNDTQQDDTNQIIVNETTTENVETDSNDQPDVATEVDGIITTDNSFTNDAPVSGTPYPNSFCVEPGTTFVSYEDSFAGVAVPYPASGFGWDGTQLCDLEGSRELDVIEVLVPFVKQRPDTDGIIVGTEWRKAANAGTYNYETRHNDIDNLLASPVADYQDGAGYSEWWAMHDGTNLYVRVRVSNDSLRNVIIDSEEPWNDDGLELFIDGDNSKGDSYDGIDDFQALLTPHNNILPFIPAHSASGLRIFHRSGGMYAYDIEVTINLASAGIETGRPFGFDLHINEDDNGGERDAKWGWFEKSGFDRSWMQPSRFGTLLLTDCENRDQCGSFQSLTPVNQGDAQSKQ